MNNVTVENINNLVGSLYNPIRTVNRDVKSISLSGGDPILPDENKNINIPSYDGNPGLLDNDIYNELMSKIPTKLSELQNDSSYVQDSNYVHTDNNFTTSYKDKLDDTYQKNEVYTKEESYSKSEVDNKIASIVTTTFEVVDQLPEHGESNVIYLVPSEQAADNEYEEYIWVNNNWELIGTTRVDLTPYYTSEQVDQLLNPINENINQLQQNKLNKNLGTDNAGKHLSIDSDGNILPVDNVVTTDELTGALLGEQQARQKQDDLLQGEIDTKMAPANILPGDNIDVSQDGLNVTVSATVPKYTAGTNMEITEDGVINNTIPYRVFDNSTLVRIGGIAYGGRQDTEVPQGSLLIGNTYGPSSGSFIGSKCIYSVAIGQDARIYNSGSSNNVVIGYDAHAGSPNNVVIGRNASADLDRDNSIVLGNYANSTKANQFTIGSDTSPINEMRVVTSTGEKFIATTDLIDALTQRIEALENANA